jgi:hypothetical protein
LWGQIRRNIYSTPKKIGNHSQRFPGPLAWPRFSFIKDKHRRLMHAMVHFMDEEIGEMVQLLKDHRWMSQGEGHCLLG